MKKIKLDELPQNLTLRELAQVAVAFGYELSVEVGGEPIAALPATCKGVTRQNFRCKNKPSKGSAYCHEHQKLEQP